MISENGRAFGELSIKMTRDNREFCRDMELGGKKFTIPVRSGELEVIWHAAAGEGPAPTIFEIYGGCFSQGYVANGNRLRTRMNQATGYNVIGLDYRHSPEFPYPCGLEDVFDAVCYFVDHAEEYRIDTSRMGTWGHSAGGNFACVLPMLGVETGKYKMKCMLLDYPYLDAWLPGIEKTTSPIGLTADVLDAMNEIYAPNEICKDPHISPVYADDKLLAQLPGAAIVVCGVDPLNTEAEIMAQRLLNVGVEVLAKKYVRASHGFIEHWFFREFYMDALSAEERAGMPADIGEQAEEALGFVISAAKHFLEA